MEIKEFIEDAKAKFGDKILTGPITVTSETTEQFGITQEDADKYGPQAWLKDNSKCPICGKELFGFFGTFQWGMANGVGECSACHKVQLRLYHRIGEKTLDYPAIIAF